MCLLELRYLYEKYHNRVKHLGFSGHHLGIAVDVAGYALGATWNERHFTKDRTWKGTDHAASLEPAGMAKLCRDLKVRAPFPPAAPRAAPPPHRHHHRGALFGNGGALFGYGGASQATWQCMTTKQSDVLPIESEQRAKLKWGCYNKDKVVK